MSKENEITMTYSGPLMKDGKKLVCVRFERGASDYAEGTVPAGDILKAGGFTDEEIEQLRSYLICNTDEIINKAKEVNFLREWLKN